MKRALLGPTRSVIAAAAIISAGCASAPMDRNVEKSRTYSIGYEQVWEGLVGFFAGHNMPIKNIAKDSGVIFAETVRFDDRFADCGSAGLWRPIGRRVGFNVFVTKRGDKQFVNVNTEFVEVRRLYEQIQNVSCVSTGLLEQQVLDSIR